MEGLEAFGSIEMWGTIFATVVASLAVWKITDAKQKAEKQHEKIQSGVMGIQNRLLGIESQYSNQPGLNERFDARIDFLERQSIQIEMIHKSYADSMDALQETLKDLKEMITENNRALCAMQIAVTELTARLNATESRVNELS